MKVRLFLIALIIGLAVGLGLPLSAQGTLSQQVLALLARTNAWTGTQTFNDIRVANAAVPSTTTYRIYADQSGNLYFNGGLIAGAGGGVTPHNFLSSTHSDTLAGSPLRGSVVVGNSTPKWAALPLCTSGNFIGSDGTDTKCMTSAAAFTAIPAAQITGTIAAVSGVNLTNLNATNLGSGTVPTGRLTGVITNAEVNAAAAIAYSKLALTGGIVNADVSGSAAIAYSKLTLTTSIVNGDIANATILFAKWASNSCTNLQVAQYNGSAWVCKTLITSDVSGAGTVSSVALTAPAIFAVGGTPVTTTGTLAITLATQAANIVFAGPVSGGAVAPTFRALVNADLPISGVGAGTYAVVTVNTRGVVTAATAQASLTTNVSGTLPMANGGTGVAVSADDTILVGTGAAWAAQTLPNCVANIISYTQATNAFACTTFAHNLLSATHGDTVAASPVRGDIIVANTTPAWTKLAKGAAGTALVMGVAGTDPGWGNAVSGLTASTAGAGTIGAVATPFASVIIGTAATNNLTVTPAAFTQTTTATVDNPSLAAVKLPLVMRGTISYTAGALTTGTCSAAVTSTVTGLTTTSVIAVSHNGAPGAQWQKGIYFLAYPTANTVNVIVCNPTAGSLTPDNATFNYAAVVP